MLVAAAAKLVRGRESRAAMAALGFDSVGQRWLAWGLSIAAELAIAGGLLAGSATAAYAGAALMLLMAASIGGALMRGRAGAPCGCFGGRSTVSGRAVARNLLLAAALVSLPSLPADPAAPDLWLLAGFGLALAAAALLLAAPAAGRLLAPWWEPR